MIQQIPHYDVIVIGTGFGGSMTALPLAERFSKRRKGERILMLERGTWWTTPVSTVQDKEVRTAQHIANAKQPVRFWSSQNHFQRSCRYLYPLLPPNQTKKTFLRGFSKV